MMCRARKAGRTSKCQHKGLTMPAARYLRGSAAAGGRRQHPGWDRPALGAAGHIQTYTHTHTRVQCNTHESSSSEQHTGGRRNCWKVEHRTQLPADGVCLVSPWCCCRCSQLIMTRLGCLAASEGCVFGARTAFLAQTRWEVMKIFFRESWIQQ